MQREQRLTGSKRFSVIHQKGQTWANRLLVLKVLPNDLDVSRFGILVGKRTGNAVVRNKVKRRLREAIRLAPVKAGCDVILIARMGASQADYHQLGRAAQELFTRAGLIANSATPSPTPQGRAEA